MLKSLSLRAKLPLSILAVILVTLSLCAVFIARTANSVVSYTKSSRMEDASLAIGNSISVQLQGAGKDMVLAAGLPMVFEGVILPPQTKEESQETAIVRASLTGVLNRIKVACGYYESFYLVNAQGDILAGMAGQSRNLLDSASPKWFEDTMQKNIFVVSQPFIDSYNNETLLPVSLKVIYNGEAGALVGMLQLDKITRGVIREATRPGVTPYVVTEDGKVLAAQNSAVVGSKIFAAPWFDGVRDQVSGSINVNVGGETKTIGFYHIPQTNLYSIIIADEEYMSSYIRTINLASLGAVLVAALLATGCVCLFVFPVTRDIRQLSLFAGQITRGDEANDTGVKRTDELGALSDSLGQMVTSLKDMLARSEAATKVKSEFLARMSHEIRTPMNGIIGMTYLAMRNNPDEKQMVFLRRINVAATTLLDIINDILDFSKMEANKMEIKNASFSISGMLQSVYDLVQIKAEEKGLDLSFSVADNVPDVLIGDSLRLSQVCINICTNALKFTESGSVNLDVTLKSKDDKKILLLFAIKDTGIGISKDVQEHIFDSFSQADGSITRKYGGTGLGLSISKLIVKMMGGNIWLQSEPGKGSTFYFTVEVQEGTAEDIVEKEHSLPGSFESASFLNLKVLLVEDNEINQEIAREILNDMGIKVTMAQNGAEALELWQSDDFDLIFMDIQMPVMDGLTAARAIRDSDAPRAKSIPIIAMTANAMSGDREKSLEAGMNEHITKPLNIEELRQALIVWGAARQDCSENKL